MNWHEAVWGVAYGFHFPASDICEMGIDELLFWNHGLGEIGKWLKDSH